MIRQSPLRYHILKDKISYFPYLNFAAAQWLHSIKNVLAKSQILYLQTVTLLLHRVVTGVH